MAHRCGYYGRIEIENGCTYRIIRAEYGTNPETQEVKYSLDVFRECLETGLCQARNVKLAYIGGWLVDFPGERVKIPYSNQRKTMELEEWWEIENYGGFSYSQNEMAIEEVKDKILQQHPNLKYLMKKLNIDIDFQYSKLFEIIRTYWKHPECETLMQVGFYKLALNESLYKLSKSKLKQVLQCVQAMIKRDKVNYDLSLKDVQIYMKHHKEEMTFDEWYTYYCWNDKFSKCAMTFDYTTFKYCMRKDISKYEYRDYLEMTLKVGHNIEDPYWKYPNDFRKFHDKVMEQQKALEISKYGIQQDFLQVILEPMLKFNKQINGYDVFMSTDAKEWQLTCDTLYQCLLRNGYMKKVIMQETLIVFIWKDGIPQATAEINYKKQIEQFYGDESGHSRGESCAPSEEVEAVLNEWLKEFKPKKSKFNFTNTKKKYYKGFNDIVDGGFHTNVGKMDGVGNGSTFLIGHIYDTDFEDETIITLGGRNCVSTEKVFHFCDTITEISKHYSPKYYAEIRALGPVVENNGALLSNRIEIVRAIPAQEIQELLLKEKQQGAAING